jgi:hypothetical protein
MDLRGVVCHDWGMSSVVEPVAFTARVSLDDNYW